MTTSAVLEFTRKLPAPPAQVYRALTDPRRFRLWWGPPGVDCPSAEMDVQVGGRYRVEMALPSGDTRVLTGEYRAVEENRLLSYTWKWGEADEDTQVSLVTITLAEADGATILSLRHEGFDTHEDRDTHRDGWTGALDCLEELITNGGMK